MTITTQLARVLLPVAAITGLVAGASAGSAGASPPVDYVRIAGVNIDFGDGGLSPVGVPDPMIPGILEWDVSNDTVRPHLSGELYLKNAWGMHAKVRVRYFDVFGNRLATRHSAEEFAYSNAEHAFDVDIDGYENPSIYRVEVATRYKLGDGWFTAESASFTI